ncbi:hypothetical protein Tco_1055439 [Tanacetum coccineum]|uniref:Uncharacterized protein n=1 Tax=Tanacetum coccineum TaxID=301880 RepID=A0ABQ5H1N7_9ASTR
MCTYVKNIAGWKPKDLKKKSFANIQELFDKAFKRVNTFVDFRTELMKGTEMEESSKIAEVMKESSSKRAGDKLQQESSKKQKMDDDQERAELKSLVNVIHDEEEVAVDAIPLATKPPSILSIEDAVWRNLQESKVLVWKLFDSYGVHFVRFQNLHVFKLVEKRYPLTPATIIDMLNKKLQADHLNKMCYQLLKLITKQLKNQ